ncbi:PIR Superfamily Protein [Plasmodium ovale curtisi]|uniref:PIR Superfamily Protein n=1 Tax=Plasmodium ovale curtisi TaxID=864141 RepID=A0A1A8VS55_PLAOA|nr:PIR Superfamily Protein [Plasmodium ovale curtisi]
MNRCYNFYDQQLKGLISLKAYDEPNKVSNEYKCDHFCNPSKYLDKRCNGFSDNCNKLAKSLKYMYDTKITVNDKQGLCRYLSFWIHEEFTEKDPNFVKVRHSYLPYMHNLLDEKSTRGTKEDDEDEYKYESLFMLEDYSYLHGSSENSKKVMFIMLPPFGTLLSFFFLYKFISLGSRLNSFFLRKIIIQSVIGNNKIEELTTYLNENAKSDMYNGDMNIGYTT